MAQSITPLADHHARARSVAGPLLLEATLVAAVIGLLLPLFSPFAVQDNGRDARFAATAIAVRDLPAPVLPELCARHGAQAETLVRDRLCARADMRATDRIERVPAMLARAIGATTAAFRAPLDQAQARIAELREQQRSGEGDVLALDQAIDATRAEIEPFARRYVLDADGRGGPRPLACATAWMQDAIAASGRHAMPVREAMRADALLLLAAALDGHAAVGALAAAATLPATTPADPACASLAASETLDVTASVMADARNEPAGILKSESMRTLLHVAGWQWAIGALLALGLLNLSRLGGSWVAGAGVALLLWAGAAWAGRVAWPLGSEHAFVLARAGASWRDPAAPFVVAMAVGGVALCALAVPLRRWTTIARAVPASILAYPGLVIATGIGWIVLLDLSANGHFGNRFLALYHQGHLWLGAAVFSLVAFVRQPLAGTLAWTLSVCEGIGARMRLRMGSLAAGGIVLALGLFVTALGAVLLMNMRQLTSELGRLWLIVGAAWFFFPRGTPLAERAARAGTSWLSLARYGWPLVFVVLVLIGAMVVTRDMGPLLIAGYASGAFVAASVAMWRYQRSGATPLAYVLAVGVFAAWIALTTAALFRLGTIDEVTAARLENAAAPLASANDHLALVTWFQRAAPASGYGPGAVPWCGQAAARTCAGVPAQIQSDYTFTALVGMFGWTAAWAITIGCVVWLEALVRRHASATRGEPRLTRVGPRVVNDEQAFASWLCVTWVVLTLCQLAVTVAGNLAVIPLTGVTFPFVSFGMTSLVANMAMLALAVNLNAPRDTANG